MANSKSTIKSPKKQATKKPSKPTNKKSTAKKSTAKKTPVKRKTKEQLRAETSARMQGNEFWKARSRHGKSPIFKSPEELMDACEDYFQHNENNPIMETKLFCYEGEIIKDEIPKMAPFTLEGLYTFLSINRQTFKNYENKEEFKDVCERVRNIIYNQKFRGAAAGFLNPVIIARDIGLADKKDHTSSDGSMTPKRDFNDFYLDDNEAQH